jgi:uncharacterized SAM-dependent methyltransferase
MNPASGRQETAIGEDAFVRDVRAGLGHPTQKWLPPRYFYDDVGSALFEAITLLPEYGLARAMNASSTATPEKSSPGWRPASSWPNWAAGAGPRPGVS